MDALVSYTRRVIPATVTHFMVPSVIFPLAGAEIDLWFTQGLYYDLAAGGSGQAVTSYLSCSRASIGYAKTQAGTLTQFGTDTLRITNLGLLIEGARENLIWPSVPVGTSNWADFNTNHTDNSTTAPDGTTTALNLNDGVANNTHTFYIGANLPTLIQNSTYTASCWLKNVDRGYGYIQLTESGSFHSIYAIINLSTGVVTAATSTGANWTFVSSATEAYGSGWWRVSVTGTYNGSGTLGYPEIGLSNDGTTRSYTGSTKTILAWGVNVEEAIFASSYIQTTTTTATRAADAIVSIGNLQTALQGTTYSAVVDAVFSPTHSMNGEVLICDGGGSGVPLRTHDFDTQIRSDSTDSTVLSGTLGNSLTWNIGAKGGYGQDGTGRSLVGGGGTVLTDAHTCTMATQPRIGSFSIYWNGYFHRLTAWTSRLADSTLQSLTSP